MKQILKSLAADEQAASMTEYALLLALIAVATIGALQILGVSINNAFTSTSDHLEAAIPSN